AVEKFNVYYSIDLNANAIVQVVAYEQPDYFMMGAGTIDTSEIRSELRGKSKMENIQKYLGEKSPLKALNRRELEILAHLFSTMTYYIPNGDRFGNWRMDIPRLEKFFGIEDFQMLKNEMKPEDYVKFLEKLAAAFSGDRLKDKLKRYKHELDRMI